MCRAFLVHDDYHLGFRSRDSEDVRLLHGWYPLEQEEGEWFRWTGKRAAVETEAQEGSLVFKVKNGRPDKDDLGISLYNKQTRRRFTVRDRGWNEFVFPLKVAKGDSDPIYIEADDFWIPAENLKNNMDQRELGLLVQDIRLST
jgi:hypothetical protein